MSDMWAVGADVYGVEGTSSGSSLAEIEPGSVLGTSVPLRADPTAMAVSGTNAWLAYDQASASSPTGAGGAQVVIDGYALGSTTRSIELPVQGLGGPALLAPVPGGGVVVAAQSTSSAAGPLTGIVVLSSSGATEQAMSVAGTPTALVSGAAATWLAVDAPGPDGGPASYLVALDPATGTTGQPVEVPLGFSPEAAVGSVVWGIEQGTGDVLAVDPTTGAVMSRLVLSNGGSFATADAVTATPGSTTLWVAATSGPGAAQIGLVFEVDGVTGEVVAHVLIGTGVPFGGAGSIASTPGGLWIATSAGLISSAVPGG